MKRTAWTQSLAGLPFNTIALAISANAHAVDQRIIEVRFLGAVLVILFSFTGLVGLRIGIAQVYSLIRNNP